MVAGTAREGPVELDESMIGWPSRRAFSRAAFSARAFLSASIWALTAALAFASSIFSKEVSANHLKISNTICLPRFLASASFNASLSLMSSLILFKSFLKICEQIRLRDMRREPFLLCAEGLHSLCFLVLLPRPFWHVFLPFFVLALQVSVSFPPLLAARSKVGFSH